MTCPGRATGPAAARGGLAPPGRRTLAADRAPAGIETTGAADLDLLRRVFPGY